MTLGLLYLYFALFSFFFKELFSFLLMWTVFKVSIEFVTILALFNVCFFGHEIFGILALSTGFEPKSPVLEDEVLTTGQSGKYLEGASC